MNVTSQNIIQTEREKLNRMIDDTMTKRVPLSKNDDIQKQGKFLEQLLEQDDKDKGDR